MSHSEETHNVARAGAGPVVQARDISGTINLGAVQLPPEVEPALSGLPRGSAAFTGRDTDLKELLDLLDPDSPDAGVIQVSALAGLGGIGKTELAIQAAHAARARGWFPGGILFVNLFGYDPERRVEPGVALDGFLQALGLPSEQVPAEAQSRVRKYRSILAGFARLGRPILVIVDNASTDEQAEPLLPPTGAGRAIVTSRHTLAGLNARLLDLSILTGDASVHLLREQLRVARGAAESRAVDDPASARSLADLCGGLPLAIGIVASLLAAHPERSLARTVTDLADARTRLDELAFGNRAVNAAFDHSYRNLSPEQARLFRLLALSPGPEISTMAAAALTAYDRRRVEKWLESLARAHLIASGSAEGRWRMHDLVRLYAERLDQVLADPDDRSTAWDRLLHYYKSLTTAAVRRILAPHRAQDEHFTGYSDALAWLKTERPNLTATVMVAAADRPRVAIDLSYGLLHILLEWRFFEEAAEVCRAVLRSAGTIGARYEEANWHDHLGIALACMGNQVDALPAAKRAVALMRELTDADPDRYERGLGRMLANLAFRTELEPEQRLAAAEEAIAIGRRWTEDDQADSSVALAGALDNLSGALADLGRHGEAVAPAQEAVVIRARQARIDPRRFEPFLAGVLLNLARRLSETGRHAEAVARTQEAVSLLGRLAEMDPVAHTWKLPPALRDLAERLRTLGLDADAEAATEEADVVERGLEEVTGGVNRTP